MLGDDTDPVVSEQRDIETTTIAMRAHAELTHGAQITADLASVGLRARCGLLPHPAVAAIVVRGRPGRRFRRHQWAPASRRCCCSAADGVTQVGGGISIGTGPARSMRWINATTSTIDDQFVRVQNAECNAFCGPDDQYRLRMWETTATIPRFSNSGSQVTVLILQNTGSVSAQVRVYSGIRQAR